ncbi:STAS domain-containing protein [Streptomyces sp. NPDC005925]|uniref:STAS domain-containing protein n=1 Tax=Streptomyces sp. NPDC005925 TaxID=3157172 RepID=UPI003405DF1C
MPIAQNPLSVEVVLPREDVALFRVQGYLDVDTSADFQHHLANQLHHGRRHFLLDLSSVPFMDSSGMNIILRVYQEVREMPGSVHVISPAPAVRRILDLTGVSITVPVSDSVEEALDRVGRGPAVTDAALETSAAAEDSAASQGADGGPETQAPGAV